MSDATKPSSRPDSVSEHMADVHQFNDFRAHMLSGFRRQRDIMERLVENSRAAADATRRILIIEKEWQLEEDNGDDKRRVVVTEADVEARLPLRLRRMHLSSMEQLIREREQIFSIRIEAQRFSLAWRHCQLWFEQMQARQNPAGYWSHILANPIEAFGLDRIGLSIEPRELRFLILKNLGPGFVF